MGGACSRRRNSSVKSQSYAVKMVEQKTEPAIEKKVLRGKTKNFCTLSVESTSRLLLADGETANGMRSGSTNGVRTAKAKTDRTAARALTHATSRRQTHRILIKTRHMPCKHMLYVITLFAARLSGMLFRDC